MRNVKFVTGRRSRSDGDASDARPIWMRKMKKILESPFAQMTRPTRPRAATRPTASMPNFEAAPVAAIGEVAAAVRVAVVRVPLEWPVGAEAVKVTDRVGTTTEPVPFRVAVVVHSTRERVRVTV
jgi:hypothetical protein